MIIPTLHIEQTGPKDGYKNSLAHPAYKGQSQALSSKVCLMSNIAQALRNVQF